MATAPTPPAASTATTASPVATPAIDGAQSLPSAPARPPPVGDVRAAVTRLAWPVIGEQLLQTLVGVVDMALVGRLGPTAVAGVGAATQLTWLAISAMGALSVGATVLVARETGAGRPTEAARVTAQSLLAGVVVGLLLAAVGNAFARPLIGLLGPEAAVVEQGEVYLRIVTLAMPALVVALVAGGAFRGAGDTRTPLYVGAGMNAVNVLLAYLLIFGRLGLPALGVGGAAVGAAAGYALGAAVLLGLLLRRGKVAFRQRAWRPDMRVLRRVLRIGVPTAVEQCMLSAGFLLYGAMVITLGTVVYATQRITFQAINLAFMPAFGFATAATTLVGQSLGAGRPELAATATRAALRQALFWMTLAGVLFAALAEPLMHVFSDDPEVIALGKIAIPVLAVAQPLWAVGQVYAGSLRGAGDARFPMVATSVGMWTVRLPTAYLFGILLGWGLPGVYLSSIFDAGLRALLNYRRHRTDRWREMRV